MATSLTLVSCTGNQNNASDTKPSGIKTKVLRMGYQQAGDLVRIMKVLEKRLEPLGIKVEWTQFAQGLQLMEAMNVGKIDLGTVGKLHLFLPKLLVLNLFMLLVRTAPKILEKGVRLPYPQILPLRILKILKDKKSSFKELRLLTISF